MCSGYLDEKLFIGIHHIDIDIIEPAMSSWLGKLLEETVMRVPQAVQFKHVCRDESRSLS